jgi:hypothetical protein
LEFCGSALGEQAVRRRGLFGDQGIEEASCSYWRFSVSVEL